MTREQAIELARTRTGQADPANFIDLCVALGMLKLDEPKSVHERVIAILKAGNSDFARDYAPAAVLQMLDLAGLKIVEK